MLRKTSRRIGNEPRKMNGITWSRKRGGAGAVVCGLAVAVMLLALSITPATNHAATRSPVYPDEPKLDDHDFDPTSWETPDKTTVPATYDAGIPDRMPV
jgi:hypothetical protein